MYFEPRVLHTPTELHSKIIRRICKLGSYWQNFTNGTPNLSETCLNTHFCEGINQNFDLFLEE